MQENSKKNNNKTGVVIYGTMGPSCRELNTLKEMFREGMNGIRLNLSHTTLEEASNLIETFNKAALECNVTPELLIDMQGPELRIGALDKAVRLKDGEMIGLEEIAFPEVVVQELINRAPGQEILLDDGKLLLQTETSEKVGEGDAGIILRVMRGGILESRKSVALPGCNIKTPAMTLNDREQIRRAREFGVTAVMQPFVRSKEDLMEVRKALDEAGGKDIRLFAKIENKSGISHLEELIPYCDEIVIARGDLGNAMELWELPAVQKHISKVCREAGRAFMVVTQMLDSMTHRQVPTRAEVSDIFNAVLDGAASVMVTGETATGDYPVQVIHYLAKTVHEAQLYLK